MKRRLDIPHALFIGVIGGTTIWYCLDARAASSDIQNLGLIAPVSAMIVALCAVGLWQSPNTRPAISRRVFGAMALLGVYVLTMDRIGFDLATWLYILTNLLVLGERRIWLLAMVPLVFAAVVTFAFANLLQTPMPLLFGGGE